MSDSPKISVTADELQVLDADLGTRRFKALAGVVQRNILAERERCIRIITDSYRCHLTLSEALATINGGNRADARY